MASTNKTTNYELSQFIETDRPAWLTDYNGDMRTIDSTMKAISDVASGASGSISALADRMSTAEGNITTNTNDIDALDARADSLEAQAQSTAGTIANIQTEQTAQNLGIEAATELGYNLARPYDSASTYAVGAYVLFQNTLYKCIVAVSTGEAFDPAKWIAIKATDEISAGGYTLPIASASQLGGVKVGNNLSIDPGTGELSANGYTLPIAGASQLGGIMVGDGLSIDPLTGVLSASGGTSDNIITIDYDSSNPNDFILSSIASRYQTQNMSQASDLTGVAFRDGSKVIIYSMGHIRFISFYLDITLSVPLTTGLYYHVYNSFTINQNHANYRMLSNLSSVNSLKGSASLMGTALMATDALSTLTGSNVSINYDGVVHQVYQSTSTPSINRELLQCTFIAYATT